MPQLFEKALKKQSVGYITNPLESEKNIHLSFNNIIKDLQRNSAIKSICVTGGKHLDLPENFDGLKVLKKE